MFETEEKEKLICAETKRLKRIYGKIDKKRMALVIGTIQRAAFLRVSLQELEDDINRNGYTEPFCQGNQEPYDRKRPNAETYKSFYDSYLKTIKQLNDLLPKEEAKPVSDGFDEFVGSRKEI